MMTIRVATNPLIGEGPFRPPLHYCWASSSGSSLWIPRVFQVFSYSILNFFGACYASLFIFDSSYLNLHFSSFASFGKESIKFARLFKESAHRFIGSLYFYSI